MTTFAEYSAFLKDAAAFATVEPLDVADNK
jgi:hypothetical protein